jgi:hypothetical protein
MSAFGAKPDIGLKAKEYRQMTYLGHRPASHVAAAPPVSASIKALV